MNHFFKQIDRGEIISSGWTAAEINKKGYLLKYYNYGEILIGAIVSQEKVQQILSYGQDTDTGIEFFVTNNEKKLFVHQILPGNTDRNRGKWKFCVTRAENFGRRIFGHGKYPACGAGSPDTVVFLSFWFF